MANVVLKHVSSTSGDSRLNGVSAEFADGEFVVIAGPERSGKSAVLRAIAGLDDISAGEISIGDRPVNDVAPKDREVAMVFWDYALFPQMSARENIEVGLKTRNFAKGEIDKRLRAAAAILGLETRLEQKPAALSSEERLRVALGRGIVRQPKALLLEDPLANLSLGSHTAMRAELARLHQRLQITMIYATSSPTEALSLGERVLVLRDGAAQQFGTPQAIYAEPANMFVAGFFGEPPMNLIHGTLKQERESLLFREAGDGTVEVRWPVSALLLAGKAVVLGVRPEEMTISAAAGSGAKEGFPALVEVVEPVGAETYLHLQTGAHSVICRSRSAVDRQDAGRRIRFTIDSAKAHLFDPDSTERIAFP
ncbi:MAG: ABC transporter ATP-binding protein [Verrucomicrobiota bacterium]|nr:ABC transporter ATP-binding protein [Verrucomicrobiota bacterium]